MRIVLDTNVNPINNKLAKTYKEVYNKTIFQP